MTRTTLLLGILLATVTGCRRSEQFVRVPQCSAPRGFFARRQSLALVRDSVVTGSDRGRIVVHVIPGDSVPRSIEAVVRAKTLRDPGTPQPIDRLGPAAFRGTLPAGRAELWVGSLGYESRSDTVAIRDGFTDTVWYSLKPACIGL